MALDQTDDTTTKAGGSVLGATVLVPFYDLESFNARLAKLNAKAASFGLEPITIKQTQEVAYLVVLSKDTDDTSFGRHLVKITPDIEIKPGSETVRMLHMDIQYPIIKLGQWNVIAQVQPAESGSGNVIFNIGRNADDEKQLSKWMRCPIGCQHCKVKRTRKTSYILKNPEGELIEVGSTCLEDFTGIDPSAALFMAKMNEFFAANWGEDDERWARDAKATGVATESYLTNVLFCIEDSPMGFVSATKAKDAYPPVLPTYAEAQLLYRNWVNDPELRERFFAKQPALKVVAQKIIAWAQSLPDESTDLYLHNLKQVLTAPDILDQPKFLALAASAPAAYHRATLREADMAPRSKPRTHIGSKDQKLSACLTLHRKSSYETQFGIKHVLSMRDDEGNVVTWKTASPPTELRASTAIGKRFEATFKIKEHTDYQGTPQTEVSHLKIICFKDALAPSPDHEAPTDAETLIEDPPPSEALSDQPCS